MGRYVCHTLRGCVDWNFFHNDSILWGVVSHPSWVCGLKPSYIIEMLKATGVTPFVGVWIETYFAKMSFIGDKCHTLRGCVDWNTASMKHGAVVRVTPFVGVWIETASIPLKSLVLKVTPFVGVWIETNTLLRWQKGETCHTLRGCVDWNSVIWNKYNKQKVTPFVGVWIETFWLFRRKRKQKSHPSWVCGLKLVCHRL